MEMNGSREEILSARNWFVERMECCFIAADKDLRYLDANESAKKIFPKLRELMPEDNLPEEVSSLFSDGRDTAEIDGRSFRKRVDERWGDESYSCLCLTDRTSEEELVRELEDTKKDADATNITRSVFLSNMSHEIRTPMNAIVGMSDILMREDLPAHLKGYLNNIKGSVGTLLSIINDILDISKIEDGTLKIMEEEYEPMSILDDLAMIFLNRIGKKPVELLYMIDPSLPSKLCGDARRIQQIIINMFNNAVEYTDSGYILLSIVVEEQEDDYCTLSFSITDTGQGIREEDRGDLFSPLHKAGSRQRSEKEGLGLGLSICKQLVRLMGGDIGVESTYGSGSRFYFTLSQGVANGEAAAELHDKETKRKIYYHFENHYLEESLIRLSGKYGVSTVKYEEDTEISEGVERKYFFTDSLRKIDNSKLEELKKAGAEICLLNNPMLESLKGNGYRVINKPLYSLNFCQILNDDLSERGRYELDFTAPDVKVLFVDDNEMNLQVAKGLLQPLEMKMDFAVNGKEGVEKVAGNAYDIVFMDHMMPVMDGVEAMERIRVIQGGRYKDLPIIALSANATADAEVLFREKGFTDFIAKPIKIREMSRVLREWLPEDKILEGDRESHGSPEESEVQIPSEIEGLDVENGIAYCGSPALFLKCMVIFYKIIDKNTSKIRKYLEDGLIRDYTIEVHALKNSARMIGAQKLSDDFKELEQMGNNEDIDGITRKTPEVLDLYQSYKQILKPFANTEKQNSYTPTPEEVVEQLKKIIEAMDSFDMDGADEAMGVLREYALPSGMDDRILELDALVSDFAMEDVIKLSEELINGCNTYFEEGKN